MTDAETRPMAKARLPGESFWVCPVVQFENGTWRCRVANNLVMHPYKIGDMLDVTPDMWIDLDPVQAAAPAHLTGEGKR